MPPQVVQNLGWMAESSKVKKFLDGFCSWRAWSTYFIHMEVDVGLVIEDLISSVVFCRVIEHLVS